MIKRRERRGSFPAIGENGRQVRINVYVDIIDAGHQKDPHAEIEGPLKELRTDDSDAVNRLEKGKYQVVSTGEILRSQDASAV